MDLIGVAALITAVTTPVVLVYLAHLNQKVTKSTQVVAALDEKVTHIDHAVNGKEPGAQSMVSQVADIHEAVLPEGGSG